MRSTNVQENLHYSEFETYRKNYDTWGMHICEVKIDSEQNQDMGLHLLDGSSHRAVWSVDVNVNLRRLIIRRVNDGIHHLTHREQLKGTS